MTRQTSISASNITDSKNFRSHEFQFGASIGLTCNVDEYGPGVSYTSSNLSFSIEVLNHEGINYKPPNSTTSEKTYDRLGEEESLLLQETTRKKTFGGVIVQWPGSSTKVRITTTTLNTEFRIYIHVLIPYPNRL